MMDRALSVEMLMHEKMAEAVKSGNIAAVEELLNVNTRLAGACDENGVSLIFNALYRKYEKIAQLLASHVKGLSLHEAAALGKIAHVEDLLKADEELINTPSADGFRALHLAAFFGRDKVVDRLLRKGADPNQPTTNEMSLYPINSAAAGGSTACVRLLLLSGANPNAVQRGKVTPLMSAAATGNRVMADLLLKHGARLDLHSETGHTAADYARSREQKALADYLEPV